MSPSITLVVDLRCTRSAADELRPVLRSLARLARQSGGCTVYHLHEAQDTVGEFLLYEIWENDAALTRYNGSAEFAELAQRVVSLVSEPVRIRTFKAALPA